MKRGLEIWCDISSSSDANILAGIRNAPIDAIVARPDQLVGQQLPERLTVAQVVDGSMPEQVSDGQLVIVESEAEARAVAAAGGRVGLRLVVRDQESLRASEAALPDVECLIVAFTDPTNIPLELLIALGQTSGTKIVKEVQTAEEALISSGVLERGAAGALFSVETMNELVTLSGKLAEARQEQLSLEDATIVETRHVGMGYRGCLDVVSLFERDEGVIVGSTSSGGLLLCAEVHPLPYMNTRPFRVNAGGVHSYVWDRDLAPYITDLRAGATVLAVNTSGRARPVTVGRVKIEVRPLRLLVAETNGGHRVNAIVQDDWHVRIFGAEGEPLNCSEIKVGDLVRAYACEAGRHVGLKVQETIEEW